MTADDPTRDVPPEDDQRIQPAIVEALLLEHGAELKRFLIGVLRDPQLAGDAMQNALVKMVERGHTTREESRKAWLFRVAYHEALLLRRRQSTGDHALRQIAKTAITQAEAADESILRDEVIQRVRDALECLPPEQRTIVRMRIYEQKKFQVIANELQIPLGTALSRMRAALGQLKSRLGDPDDPA